MSHLPIGLDSYTTDWLSFLSRWLHVIAGIAWVGSSFYFIALDNHLERPKDPQDAEEGVAGEAWEIHGGGFYHVHKYQVAPRRLPERLLWFKWEAYTTWLSGFFLFVVLYYAHAGAYLVDRTVADLSSWEAVVISLALLAAAWLVYDALCRVLRNELVLAAVLLGLVALSAWGASHLFSSRAVFIQVGAMLGTIMAANVFFVIIPAHWELVRAKEAGREPDPLPGIRAKERSVHNNYLTLPVVITMFSGHYPVLYGQNYAWLVLIALMLIGAWIRLFFNLRHAGRTVWAIPVTAAAAIALIAVLIRPGNVSGSSAAVTPQTLAAGKAVFASIGCASCHTLKEAGATGTVGPSLDSLRPDRALVIDRVTNGTGVMPTFKDRLSKAQIEAVADYVSSVAGK